MKLAILALLSSSLLCIGGEESNLDIATVLPEEEQAPLLIGDTTLIPDYSFIDQLDGQMKGVSLDAAAAAFKAIGYDVKHNLVPHDEKLDRVYLGDVDFSAANVGIHSSRGEHVKFSDPLIISNLRAAAIARDDSFIKKFFRILFGPNYILLIGLASGLVILSVALWWHDHGDPRIEDNPWKGIPHAGYFVFSWFLEIDYDYQAKGVAGKAIPIVIKLGRILFVTGLLAGLGAEVIRDKDKVVFPVTKVEDLYNARIAVKKETTSYELAKEYSSKLIVCESEVEAAQAVINGQADIVIHDEGRLQMLIENDFNGELMITGPSLKEEIYAIALRKDFEQVEELNQAIRRLRESGEIKRLQGRYLGKH